MRQIFLINNLMGGGAERVVSILANEFVLKGEEIEILCLEKEHIAYNISEKCKISFLSNSSSKSGIKKLFFLFILAFRLKKYISINNVSTVISHLYRSNYVNILCKVLKSRHQSVIVNHSSISRYHNQGLLGKVNLLLINYLYPKADLIIAISQKMANEIKNFLNVDDILVINNPFNLKEIKIKSREIVEDFEFGKKKYIICVGRLIPLKRNQDIIKIVPNLRNEIEIIFLGEGDEKNNLILLANKLNIRDRIHFIGNVSNPFKYFSRSDLFVSCSETEGFPLVLVEAMACNTFVISSDCISGPREIIAPNTDYLKQLKKNDDFVKYDFGFLFPVGNINSLQNAIEYYFSNENNLGEIKMRAMIEIEKYNIDVIYERYAEILWEKRK